MLTIFNYIVSFNNVAAIARSYINMSVWPCSNPHCINYTFMCISCSYWGILVNYDYVRMLCTCWLDNHCLWSLLRACMLDRDIAGLTYLLGWTQQCQLTALIDYWTVILEYLAFSIFIGRGKPTFDWAGPPLVMLLILASIHFTELVIIQLCIYKVDLNIYFLSIPVLGNGMSTIHIMWLYIYLAIVIKCILIPVLTSVYFPGLVTTIMLYSWL